MLENQKICRIIEEFSLYLLETDLSVLDIKIRKTERKTIISFICNALDDIYLDELEHIFQHKRREEFEVYGWELIGQGDAEEHELMLVNNLIDFHSCYSQDEKIYFNLVRYEKD